MKSLKLILNMFEDLIKLYLPAKKNSEVAFAFLVHPRNVNDYYRKYPFLKIFPSKVVEFIMQFIWPVTLSEITGLTSRQDNKQIKGWLISILFTGKMLLKRREAAKKKIIKAIKLAEKKGAKIVGLGALTSSITNGGSDLLGKIKISVTTGNSLTVFIAIEDIKKIIQGKKEFGRQPIVAVIGGTGSIGKAITTFLCRDNLQEIIVIGKTPENLKNLENKIRIENPQINLTITTKIDKIKPADIIIVATASTKAIIKSTFVKNEAVIYDISQPQNVSRDIIKERSDVKVIDGSTVSTPNINYNFNFGLPKETAFACLAETMLLAAEKMVENFSVGQVDLEKVEKIGLLSEKYNFKGFMQLTK